ncbi:hypothetical protein NL108_017484 [Boleophthalmus pectinirostris]|nr:hypothetical protein NL108_017484 [Boleophthalmus pectinirostris]
MDLEDDTTVLTTLKSFNSFISQSEPPRTAKLAAPPTLQSQYKRSLELLEAAERVQSKTRFLQLDQEKKQMELSHKKARLELEKVASDSARDLEHEQGRNQELYGRLKRLEESEAQAVLSLKEQQETQRSLRKTLDNLNKTGLHMQTISCLRDEIRDLKLKLQNQDSTISSLGLEKEELQDKLELERRLVLQEQDMSIVKMVKSEAAKVPELEKEVKRLREDNTFLRENRENCSLLKEEAEGLRKKLERAEKTREELLSVELDKEKLSAKLQAWENLGQSTGLNIKSPEDLFREVMQIQQREITLKEQNYTLNSRQKIEDLEAERQRLEQQNGELEMRLEKNTLQVG